MNSRGAHTRTSSSKNLIRKMTPPISPKSLRRLRGGHRAASDPSSFLSTSTSRRASAGDVLTNGGGEKWMTARRRHRSPIRRKKTFSRRSSKSISKNSTRVCNENVLPRRMSQILVSTLSRNHFKKFLRTEFSYENLVFVERCNTFRERCSKEPSLTSTSSLSAGMSGTGGFSCPQRRNAAALDVFFEFLSPNAHNEVHVNSEHRTNLEAAFRKAVPNFDEVYSWRTAKGIKRLSEMPIAQTSEPVAADIFTPIRNAVWSNIEQDSFQRYRSKLAA